MQASTAATTPPSKATGGEIALELRGVVKHFGNVEAVRGVDLAVEPGEWVTLVGPSGSGKTTLLRMIAGFAQPTHGAVILDGRDISALPPDKRGVGLVFQNYALFPHMSVAANVRYPLKLRKWDRSRALARVEEMLDLVGLSGLGARHPRELSGGQQQRVALARALAASPKLLLMDEPLGALDRALRVDMEEELRRIHRESAATVVYVTHDQEEALTLSDRIGVMRSGRLLQIDEPRTIYERPASVFVGTFLGECTVFPARVVKREDAERVRVVVCNQERTMPAAASLDGADDARVLVRHSKIHPDPEPGDVQIAARIRDRIYLGDTLRLICDADGNGEVVARVDAARAPTVIEPDQVTLGFSPDCGIVVPQRLFDEEGT